MTPDPAIATAADYADALMSARRGKNILLLILLLIVIAQVTLFFLIRYDVLKIDTTSVTVDAGRAGSATVTAARPATTQSVMSNPMSLLQYVIGICDYVGIAGAIVLSLILLLLAGIMLVGRLIGVGRMTGAFLLSLVIVVLFFPWQAFLNNANMDAPEFKVPGVLYTWEELTNPRIGAHFDASDAFRAILRWGRYVAIPVAAAVILLVIQVKSNRGLRQALGEETYTTDIADTIEAGASARET
jgi:hypothetical protein